MISSRIKVDKYSYEISRRIGLVKSFSPEMSYIPIEIHRRFEVTCCLHLQDIRECNVLYGKKQVDYRFLTLQFGPEDGSSTFVRNDFELPDCAL